MSVTQMTADQYRWHRDRSGAIVRDPDGSLKTAIKEALDQGNTVYFQKPDPVRMKRATELIAQRDS